VSIPVSRTGGESHDDGEVSCVALALVFQAAASRGDSLESLARGTRVGLDHLMAWDRRIGWDTFRTVMANAGETFPPEALVALGRRSPRARVARPYASVVRLLDDPVAPYRFMARPGTGIFAQLFTCLQPALEDHGGGRLELSLRLEPGRAPCPEMLHLVHGGLAALAPLVGWPEPAVSMEPLADGARYRITLAPRPSPWRRLARRARLPFSSGRAARALLRALADLDAHHHRLARAAADRDRAEARDADSAHGFRTVFHASPVAMAIVRVRDGRVLDLNAGFLALAGCERAETVGRTIHELGASLDVSVAPERWQPFLERMAGGESLRDFDVRIQDASQNVRHLSVFGEGVTLDGEACAVFQLLDVSERRREEALLRESERTYFELYENAPEIYISVDLATATILRCNRKFSEVLGLRKPEVKGLPLARIFDPEDEERVQRAIRVLRRSGKLRNVPLCARRRTGDCFDVTMSASAVRGADGRARISRVILHDLSRARPERLDLPG